MLGVSKMYNVEANSHRDLEVYAYNKFLCMSTCMWCSVGLYFCVCVLAVFSWLYFCVWVLAVSAGLYFCVWVLAVFSLAYILNCSVQLAYIFVFEYLACGVQLGLFRCLSTCNVQLAAYISGCCTLRSSVVTNSWHVTYWHSDQDVPYIRHSFTYWFCWHLSLRNCKM